MKLEKYTGADILPVLRECMNKNYISAKRISNNTIYEGLVCIGIVTKINDDDSETVNISFSNADNIYRLFVVIPLSDLEWIEIF